MFHREPVENRQVCSSLDGTQLRSRRTAQKHVFTTAFMTDHIALCVSVHCSLSPIALTPAALDFSRLAQLGSPGAVQYYRYPLLQRTSVLFTSHSLTHSVVESFSLHEWLSPTSSSWLWTTPPPRSCTPRSATPSPPQILWQAGILTIRCPASPLHSVRWAADRLHTSHRSMVLYSHCNGTVRTFSVVQSGFVQCFMEGTNIKLFGNASQTSYTVNLDGTPRPDISSSPDTNILAAFANLTDGDHILSLFHHSPSPSSNASYISFDRAVMNLPRPTLAQGYGSCTLLSNWPITPN
jgi:hypothetical protein